MATTSKKAKETSREKDNNEAEKFKKFKSLQEEVVRLRSEIPREIKGMFNLHNGMLKKNFELLQSKSTDDANIPKHFYRIDFKSPTKNISDKLIELNRDMDLLKKANEHSLH